MSAADVITGVEPAVEDAPVGHVDDALGPSDQVGVVGDHDDGPTALDEGAEELQHDLGRERVEVAGRLVGDEDRRVIGQRSGDGDALLLATGRARRQLAGLVGHPDPLEQVHRPRPGARAASIGRRSPSAA